MGWSFRKAFRLGPLRLSLSKRGVGASVGVKGARAGIDAAGKPYVAGGRHGIYFRERLGGGAPLSPVRVVLILVGVALVVMVLVAIAGAAAPTMLGTTPAGGELVGGAERTAR